MKTKYKEIVEAAAVAVPKAFAVVTLGKRLRSGRCIMMTRIGIDVLKHFGVEAQPELVEIIVGNKWWCEWVEAGMPEPMPENAYSVALIDDPTDPEQVPVKENDYPAHMVVRTAHDLIDFDFRQFSRPTKRMQTPPVVAINIPNWTVFDHEDGIVRDASRQPGWHDGMAMRLMLHRIEDARRETGRYDYEHAPDWVNGHPEVVHLAVAIMKRLMAEEKPFQRR